MSTIDIKISKWKITKNPHKDILLIPEFFINGKDEKHIIEINHFIIQTIRIPLTEQPSLQKILQLALNIGQYTGSGNEKTKWMNLKYYVSQVYINKINKLLPPNLYEQLYSIIKN